MPLDAEIAKKLKDLTEEFNNKLGTEAIALEDRLTNELVDRLEEILGREAKGLHGDIRDAAEMFINNGITEVSIGNDPSGDWDGSTRVECLAEEFDPDNLDEEYDEDDD